MILQIDFWQLLGFGGVLLAAFSAIVVGAGRLIVTQFEARINERFDALEEQRKHAADGITALETRIDARFNTLEEQRKHEAEGITSLEREFLRFQADLPRHYVRRDDFIQVIGGLSTRIDNFALRMERALDNRKGEHL